MPGPASNLLSRTETQLDTQAIMHEWSVDSKVTFRKMLGSAEILPSCQLDQVSIRLRIPGPWIHRRTRVVCSLWQYLLEVRHCALYGTWAAFLTPHVP